MKHKACRNVGQNVGGRGIDNGIGQASGGSNQRQRSVRQRVHLVQSARFVSAGHEEHI